MLKEFTCDLHIHTCLSPCCDLDMYPRAIVEKCVSERLDIIGICDHNASENVSYVIQAAKGKDLTVLPGMEITSREEVHILALFDNIDDLSTLQKTVYSALHGMNREDVFGCQPIVNELDEIEGFNERLLMGSTDLSLHESIEAIHRLNGIAIAAHIDRESFGVIGQLGFIPSEVQFDALEISHITGRKKARQQYPDLSHYSFLQSSDAHFIDDIGRVFTKVFLEKPTISELKMALKGREGRYIKD
jgi:PHP family Zn ribbon phosphoesterase